MITPFKRILEYAMPPSAMGGLRFDRPLLLFQSDDWGRAGVRDREGWDELQAAGIALGESPYELEVWLSHGGTSAANEFPEGVPLDY
ncbi:MAG: hypothetical protein WA609_20485, partial [Terriglobales bacterium]